MAAKHGSGNLSAVLNEDIVAQLRALRDSGEAQSAAHYARVYGVSAETIRRIWRRETWNSAPTTVGRLAPAPSPAIGGPVDMERSIERLMQILQVPAPAAAPVQDLLTPEAERKLRAFSDQKE